MYLVYEQCLDLGSIKGKRYYATEHDDLQAPMNNGWRRETTIREYTKSGIRGEVVYVAPCGKRFKQYPDIIRVSASRLWRDIYSSELVKIDINIKRISCSTWKSEESTTSSVKILASVQN